MVDIPFGFGNDVDVLPQSTRRESNGEVGEVEVETNKSNVGLNGLCFNAGHGC